MPKPVPELSPEQHFRVDSIAEAMGPAGDEGKWHRYVITQGTNVITGLRAGTLAEVEVRLGQMIERLNQRFAKQQAKARR